MWIFLCFAFKVKLFWAHSKWHIVFNLKSKEKAPSFITLSNYIKRQNIWLKPCSYTLVANSIAIKNDVFTNFVLVFSFVNYTTKYVGNK